MSCPAFVSSAPARSAFRVWVTCKAALDENSRTPCRASLRRTPSVVPCAAEKVKDPSLPASIQPRCLFEQQSGPLLPPSLASEQPRFWRIQAYGGVYCKTFTKRPNLLRSLFVRE